MNALFKLRALKLRSMLPRTAIVPQTRQAMMIMRYNLSLAHGHTDEKR